MGMNAPSLPDTDTFNRHQQRKPVKLANASNVIMWRVDGSAVGGAHPRRSPAAHCCTNALWRRIMCARNVRRIEAHRSQVTNVDIDADADVDHTVLALGEPRKARVVSKDVGSKLQTAFSMRRWPQGWI